MVGRGRLLAPAVGPCLAGGLFSSGWHRGPCRRRGGDVLAGQPLFALASAPRRPYRSCRAALHRQLPRHRSAATGRHRPRALANNQPSCNNRQRATPRPCLGCRSRVGVAPRPSQPAQRNALRISWQPHRRRVGQGMRIHFCLVPRCLPRWAASAVQLAVLAAGCVHFVPAACAAAGRPMDEPDGLARLGLCLCCCGLWPPVAAPWCSGALRAETPAAGIRGGPWGWANGADGADGRSLRPPPTGAEGGAAGAAQARGRDRLHLHPVAR